MIADKILPTLCNLAGCHTAGESQTMGGLTQEMMPSRYCLAPALRPPEKSKSESLIRTITNTELSLTSSMAAMSAFSLAAMSWKSCNPSAALVSACSGFACLPCGFLGGSTMFFLLRGRMLRWEGRKMEVCAATWLVYSFSLLIWPITVYSKYRISS